jgi:lysozyme
MLTKRIQIYNNTSVDLSPYLTTMFQYYQKHGVTFNYDITNVNIQVPQSTLAYNPLVGNVYVIQGVENLVPQTDHDIVLFFFDYSNWKAPWYWPWPLWGNIPRDCTYMINGKYGKPFINIGYWPTDTTVGQRFIHEPMHALTKIFNAPDQLDSYYLDSTPDAPNGNFAKQWAILQPYLQNATTPVDNTLPHIAPILSESTITLLKSFEGFVGTPYLDLAGKYTIGYGFIIFNGQPVSIATPAITEVQADAQLRIQIKPYCDAITNCVKVPINQNQFDALVSICYNEGISAITNSTLIRDLNAGLIQQAADQFLRWKYVGTAVSQGLINRRTKERTLFLTA